jgi:hypothetical protein
MYNEYEEKILQLDSNQSLARSLGFKLSVKGSENIGEIGSMFAAPQNRYEPYDPLNTLG